MKFSVVIPMYNSERTIAGTLESVARQTFDDYEVVVIDDGSRDGSAALVEAVANNDSRVKLIRKPNGGVSTARNVGITESRGEYICFLDSDDEWHRDKLLLVNRAIEELGALMVGNKYTTDAMNEEADSTPVLVTVGQYMRHNPFQTSCVCVRRDMLGAGFDEQMSHSEDYDLFLETAYRCRGRVWGLSAALTRLGRPQLSAGGLSANRGKMRLGEMRAYAKFCTRHKRYLALLPLLLTWSAAKHLRGIIRR